MKMVLIDIRSDDEIEEAVEKLLDALGVDDGDKSSQESLTHTVLVQGMKKRVGKNS